MIPLVYNSIFGGLYLIDTPILRVLSLCGPNTYFALLYRFLLVALGPGNKIVLEVASYCRYMIRCISSLRLCFFLALTIGVPSRCAVFLSLLIHWGMSKVCTPVKWKYNWKRSMRSCIHAVFRTVLGAGGGGH